MACKFARSWPPSGYLGTRSITASKCISKLSRLQPPQVHLQTCSITISECISKITQSGPPSVSPNMLDYRLQVHLQSRSITASMCISEFTQYQSPSAYSNSLNHGLQVHLWVHSISVSKCISNTLDQIYLQWAMAVVRLYRGNGGGQSDWGYILGRPRSDRHHLISIFSSHTIQFHTLFFPNCGLTRSVRDFVDPRNCIDPHSRGVSYLVIATVPDRHVGTGTRTKPNRCQIGGPGRQ